MSGLTPNSTHCILSRQKYDADSLRDALLPEELLSINEIAQLVNCYFSILISRTGCVCYMCVWHPNDTALPLRLRMNGWVRLRSDHQECTFLIGEGSERIVGVAMVDFLSF